MTTSPTRLIEVCHTWPHKQPLGKGPVLHCGVEWKLTIEDCFHIIANPRGYQKYLFVDKFGISFVIFDRAGWGVILFVPFPGFRRVQNEDFLCDYDNDKDGDNYDNKDANSKNKQKNKISCYLFYNLVFLYFFNSCNNIFLFVFVSVLSSMYTL